MLGYSNPGTKALLPQDSPLRASPWNLEPPALLGLSVGALAGHSAIRYFVMGDAATEREATASEVEAMRVQVRRPATKRARL